VATFVLFFACWKRRSDGLPYAMTAVIFATAFLTLAGSFWPYMIPFSVTIQEAAAPVQSLSFMFYGAGIVVFPGGVGTAEEILFLLGIKLHPDNADIELPLIFTGPEGSAAYFEQIDRFLRSCLGDEVAEHYRIVPGDAPDVARSMKAGIKAVKRQRIAHAESFSFAWRLHIPEELQQPFEPTHENMAALALHRDQPRHRLIADLRRAFSGIVAGNVKDFGVRAVEEKGPYQLHGEVELIDALSDLLSNFVRDGRMKIDPSSYRPCFELAR